MSQCRRRRAVAGAISRNAFKWTALEALEPRRLLVVSLDAGFADGGLIDRPFGAPTGSTSDSVVFVTPAAGSDLLSGGGGKDKLDGGGGNDRVYGGDGDDQIGGGRGRDRLFGQAGNDRLWSKSDLDLLDGGAGDDLAVGHPFELDEDTLVVIERTVAPPA